MWLGWVGQVGQRGVDWASREGVSGLGMSTGGGVALTREVGWDGKGRIDMSAGIGSVRIGRSVWSRLERVGYVEGDW